jgi:hypothetical protein
LAKQAETARLTETKILKMKGYLNILELVEHLKVYLLDKIPRKINSANPCHRAKCASPYISDLIVTEV